MNKLNWELYILTNPNLISEYFQHTFSAIHDRAFLLKEAIMRNKISWNPWPKDSTENSKRKQKIYMIKLKRLKVKISEKIIVSIILKGKAKRLYWAKRLQICKHDIKKIWHIIKEYTSSNKFPSNSLSYIMVIEGLETIKQNEIAKGFSKFFTDVEIKLQF